MRNLDHHRSNLAILLAAATAILVWPGAARAQFRPPLRMAQQPAPAGQSAPAGQPTAGQPTAGQPATGQPAGQPATGQPGGPRPGVAPGQAGAGDPNWHGAVQLLPVRPPKEPFTLTPAEEKQLNEALRTWEEKSEKIKSFKCKFARWDYDMTFGDPKLGNLKTEGEGELKYWAPDHGKYRLTGAKDRATQGENLPFEWKPRNAAELDHWVCDGESIFEVSAVKKQLIQHKLPKDMRGKAITEGPLPFVFGAKADQIKRRYFIRLVTPPEEKGKHVRLEAWPKFQSDAANYQRVTISLTEPDFVPHALQVILPGSPLPGTPTKSGGKTSDEDCSRTVYLFESPLINDKLDFVKFDWLAPWVPPTWQKVVEEAPDEQPPSAAAASNPPASRKTAPPQATRNPPPVRR